MMNSFNETQKAGNDQKTILKQYLKEEFLERLEESDIEYHFANNHAHYEAISDLISDPVAKQQIDDALKVRLDVLRSSRIREQ